MHSRSTRHLMLVTLSLAASALVACAPVEVDNAVASDSAVRARSPSTGTATYSAHERIELIGSAGDDSLVTGFTRTVLDSEGEELSRTENFVVMFGQDDGKLHVFTANTLSGAPDGEACGELITSRGVIQFTGRCGLSNDYACDANMQTCTIDDQIRLAYPGSDTSRIEGFQRMASNGGAYGENYAVIFGHDDGKLHVFIADRSGNPDGEACGTMTTSRGRIHFTGTCGLAQTYFVDEGSGSTE